MFTDDMSRTRWVRLIKTKDEAAEVLQQVITQVADPEGVNIGEIRCNGWGEFEGRFLALAGPFGIKVEPNAPYISQGKVIAEQGFGTIIGY